MMNPAFVFDHPWILISLALWDLVWNGFALYKAARQGQRKWFVALLIVNSVGILPITYLWMEKRKSQSRKSVVTDMAPPARVTKRTHR